MLNDLLLEIGTEELPSGAVWPLAAALADYLQKGLEGAGLAHGTVQAFATPRRIAVRIHDVQSEQGSQQIVKKGPAEAAGMNTDGQPTPALLGFAKSCGVSVDSLTKMQTDKGSWWVYQSDKPGMTTPELLPTLIKEVLSQLPIAKPMRWGKGEMEFARPVHWVVLLFGEEVVNAELFDIPTGRHSNGHRFHHPHPIAIAEPKQYEDLLHEGLVIVNFQARKQKIIQQIQALASPLGYEPIMPDQLLDEVTSIVEWPTALMGHFEEVFLEIPAEALIAAMQSHQKCFALRDQAGQLTAHFITITNVISCRPEQVIQGNEKVMRARLSDASFFYHQDKKKPLSLYRELLNKVVFQAGLGSLEEKTLRMQRLMDYLSGPLQLNNILAVRAAELSKCDLMTGMVGEFPELEGIMGFYYALNDGEPTEVADALKEQYLPRFAGDALPASPLGLALSLADRMDTLVGNFALGQKPSGMKDPFKLRRHALALVRLLIATPAPMNLPTLIQQSVSAYGKLLTIPPALEEEIIAFIFDRVPAFYQQQAVSTDMLQAVRANQSEWLYDFDQRVQALVAFMQLPEAMVLSAACKRVNNILRQSEYHVVAEENITQVPLDECLLTEAAEKHLFSQLRLIEERIAPLYQAAQYKEVLLQLASLREAVDAFFDHVMVMVDDVAIRDNRLHLLARLQCVLRGVADISLLQHQ